MIAAMITANAIAVAVYVGARLSGNAERSSSNILHDFFMGARLNPRIGELDLKMWAEIRVSWITLFLLTASCAAHQYAAHGRVSGPMIFMIVAHFLYANACMKGEEGIPTTWDFLRSLLRLGHVQQPANLLSHAAQRLVREAQDVPAVALAHS